MLRRLGIAVVCLATVACDRASDQALEEPTEQVTAGHPEVLIATSDDLIGLISDLHVGPDGYVYAVDQQAAQIHVIDPEGSYSHSIGRAGAGPVEFNRPTTLEARGDTLAVVDWWNGRLQEMTRDGVYLSSHPLPPGQAPSIGGGMRFVRPTWGADTVLAVVHEADLTEVAGLGTIVGDATNMVRPREMRQEIQAGQVPNIMLNTANALIAADSSTWLWVPARGTVQRFAADGSEEWILELDEPEAGDLMTEFVEENAKRTDGSFLALAYLRDVTVVGDFGFVSLGTTAGGHASVRLVRSDGSRGARLDFPEVRGAGEIAVDLERGWIYFVRQEWAELIRVPIEPSQLDLSVGVR